MHGYTTAGWENFFVAEVSAAAALAGLLFVSVSINLKRILEFKSLPGRAAEALVLLLGALSVASVGLVPGISPTTMGAIVLAIGGVTWVLPVLIQIRGWQHIRGMHEFAAPRTWIIVRAAFAQLATLPTVICGATLLSGSGGGLYWVVPAALLSFAAALFDAWVLLVEIHR